MVLALGEDEVLALEEDVAQEEGPWGSRSFGPCQEHLYWQFLECLLHLAEPAREEEMVYIKTHPAREPPAVGGTQ